MKKLSIYLLLVCLLWACGETSTQSNNHTTTTTDTAKKTSKTPTNNTGTLLDRDKFSLQYPKNWHISTKKGKEAGELLELISETISTTDQFREKVNIFIRRSEKTPFTVKSFAAIAKERLKKIKPDARIIDEDTNEKFFEIEYVGYYKKEQMKWKQRAWVKGKEAFVATYMADHDDFNAHEKEANLIMDSFKIK